MHEFNNKIIRKIEGYRALTKQREQTIQLNQKQRETTKYIKTRYITIYIKKKDINYDSSI